MTSFRQQRTAAKSNDFAGEVAVDWTFEGPAGTFVLNSLRCGGSEWKAVELANGLVERGWRVTVAYLNVSGSLREAFDESVETAPLDRVGRIALVALRRLAEGARPDEVSEAGRARGPVLIRFVTTRGLGCNEYAF